MINTASNKYLFQGYHYPGAQKPSNTFFQTWADVDDALIHPYNMPYNPVAPVAMGTAFDYGTLACAALAMTADESGGAAAWAWMKPNGYDIAVWSYDPKFAIIPR
jgi:hypothetical protein